MNAGKLLIVAAVLGMSVSAFGAGEAAPASGEMFGGVGYTYWTDYMWRGMNMTQLIGNNKGAGANQMIYTAGVDVADLGKLGVSVEQVYFNRWDGTCASIAFTNMNVFLKHAIDGSDSSVTVGYGNHFWENLRNFTGKDARSQEFYATYAFSDACIWQGLTGQESGNVLNPSLTYLVDTDKADGGSLFILGLNHPMNMADTDPSLAGITVVPTFLMVVDNRYYASYAESIFGADYLDAEGKDTTKIAYMDYGIKTMADMTEMVGLTDGKLGLSIGVGYLDGVELPDAKWYGTAGISYNF